MLLNVFFDPDSHDFSKSGVHLEMEDGTPLTIFADVAMFIADESALHAVYGCKGASGLKPCFACSNVYNHGSTRGVVENDRSKQAVYHTCTELSKMKFTTRAIMEGIVRRLTAAAGTPDLGEVQTCLGWKYMPNGVMFNAVSRRRLCPTRVACYDWAHIIFVNGVFNIHAGILLHTLRALKVDINIICQYVKSFHWPCNSMSGADVFSKDRIAKSLPEKRLKCTASEGMSVLPVLAQFCQHLSRHHANSGVRDNAYCFVQLALVAGMIFRSTRCLLNRDELKTRVETYATAFRALYGEGPMVPTFHYLYHVAFYEWVQSCLVHEGKHKSVKRFANQVYNTSIDWDCAVLREVTARHIASLISTAPIQFAAAAGLENGRKPSKTLYAAITHLIGAFPVDALRVAKTARVNKYEKVSVGDVVRVCSTSTPVVIGQVAFHISVSDGDDIEHVTILHDFNVLSEEVRCWKCRKLEAHAIFQTSDIDCALAWAGTSGGVLTVLKPLHAHRSLEI